MEQQKIDMFMMANVEYFPADKALSIRDELSMADDSKWALISSIQFKSPTIALILSIFLGYLGIDRFYLDDIGLGVGKLVTCGGCGVWALVDWFFIMNATRQKNYERLLTIL